MGPVPSSYYVRQHVKVDYEQCTVVKRGSSQQLDYEILFPGCVLRLASLIPPPKAPGIEGNTFPPFKLLNTFSCPTRWQFATENADIGFGVFLKDIKGPCQKVAQMQEVVPSQRYNAHLVPEDGSLTCERPGVCESDTGGQSVPL